MASSVDSGAIPDKSIYPRFEEVHGGESRQAPDRVIDLARGRAPVLVGEQVGGQEAKLRVRLYAAAHGRPEAVHQQARGPGRPWAFQSELRLAVVEKEVARL